MSDQEQHNPDIEQAQGQPLNEQYEAAADSDSQNDGSEAEAPAELGPEAALQLQLEEAQRQLTEAKDQALRSAAEVQNIRRRAEKDIASAHKYGLEKFAGELLMVVDNLERAIESSSADNEAVKSLIEGIELTRKSFIDVLEKFSIEQHDPVGEPFDPQFHQAMSMVENPDVEPNTVLSVMQKGYSLNGRLIRPAMVMVSKAAASTIDEQA